MAYYSTGYHTETAGTEIFEVCPPNGDKIPTLLGFSNTVAGTEHYAYVMRCRGMTTTSSFTASGDTTIELAKIDPGKTTANVDENLAASDVVAYVNEYDQLEVRKISSVSGSTITIAATDEDVPEGNKVYAFYELAAANPGTVDIRLPSSATATHENLHIQGGIPHQDGIQMSVSGSGLPVVLAINNATNASKLEWSQWTWVDASEDFLK